MTIENINISASIGPKIRIKGRFIFSSMFVTLLGYDKREVVHCERWLSVTCGEGKNFDYLCDILLEWPPRDSTSYFVNFVTHNPDMFRMLYNISGKILFKH